MLWQSLLLLTYFSIVLLSKGSIKICQYSVFFHHRYRHRTMTCFLVALPALPTLVFLWWIFFNRSSGLEIAAGHWIFPTRKWKSPAVSNSEILKMSGRVITVLSRNCRLAKVDAIICRAHYSSRINYFLSFSVCP